MENKLYYVENNGCDDATRGIVSISDEDFPKFKTFVENLNKNSTYGCMPTISVYKISLNDLKEVTYNPSLASWDDDYVSLNDVFYLNDKTYTFAKRFMFTGDLECVIKA